MTEAKHQDHICLTMITVGAATLAAVFFIMNLDNPYSGTTPAWVRASEAAVAMAAMSLYGRLVLQSSMSLANPEQLTGDEEVDLKKRQTQKVLGSFWVMIILTGFLVFIKIMVPAFLEAIHTTGEQQSNHPPPGKQLPENGSDPELDQPTSEPDGPATTPEKPQQTAKHEGPGPVEPDSRGDTSEKPPPGERGSPSVATPDGG